MTKEEALAMYNSDWWKGKSPRQICDFQLYEEKLCLPFDEFHKSVEKCLGRSVWTHEFADWEGLKAEYEGKREPESNPIESAGRILRKLGRDDLADNMIIVQLPDKPKGEK